MKKSKRRCLYPMDLYKRLNKCALEHICFCRTYDYNLGMCISLEVDNTGDECYTFYDIKRNYELIAIIYSDLETLTYYRRRYLDSREINRIRYILKNYEYEDFVCMHVSDKIKMV